MLLLILFFLFIDLKAQTIDPNQLVRDVIERFSQVRDYEADIEIKVDVEFLKVPDSKAKLYFKQPDKVKLKSDGFALLPKDGVDFSPSSIIKGNYTAIFERKEELNGIETSVIKVVPINESTNIILSTVWIDNKNKIIRKVESTTKTQGTYTIELFYDENSKYPLPKQMIFSFNVDKLNLPQTFTNTTPKSSKKKFRDGPVVGKVYVNYKNYQVNKNLSDKIFEDDTK
ncbi:MAG: outer membrane lipoprotein-sorting protein [Ignavibacterium sp.]|nr:outer membrane lipoprotein-sorting protein [Ignavibacterium sp.]